MVIRRFVSIREYPKKMRSDAGSQPVSAGKELRDIVKKMELGNDSAVWKGIWDAVGITKLADTPWDTNAVKH